MLGAAQIFQWWAMLAKQRQNQQDKAGTETGEHTEHKCFHTTPEQSLTHTRRTPIRTSRVFECTVNVRSIDCCVFRFTVVCSLRRRLKHILWEELLRTMWEASSVEKHLLRRAARVLERRRSAAAEKTQAMVERCSDLPHFKL